MNNLLLVFLGGGLGSVSRYAIGLAMQDKLRSLFPWGTFTVNILACFILGMLTAWLTSKADTSTMRLLLGIGFCGGFSTFSSFTAETMNLIAKGNVSTAVLYIGGSILACMLAFASGMAIK